MNTPGHSKQPTTKDSGSRAKVPPTMRGSRRPARKKPGAATGLLPGPSQNREQLIAEAAYLRSEHRGFAPGRELEDWLAAELEVDSRLNLSPNAGNGSQ